MNAKNLIIPLLLVLFCCMLGCRNKQHNPHIQDNDMVELAEQVLGKLEAMSDAEFAEVVLEAAE